MKSLLYVAALSLALLPMVGCETLTDTPAENGNRMVRTMDTNVKGIPDDTERLLLLDRPSMLTDKPVPSNQ